MSVLTMRIPRINKNTLLQTVFLAIFAHWDFTLLFEIQSDQEESIYFQLSSVRSGSAGQYFFDPVRFMYKWKSSLYCPRPGRSIVKMEHHTYVLLH